eukprot:TRINITY_DN835_c0_g1_i2.p1 TRINITY_DN835_c0_g1~~TRINITY_DN835_c0_g1_i2.p1  ORF type:complete len:416 (-),score=58.50 TRINITY_DN835_c0_g1_i2:672-1919(-)
MMMPSRIVGKDNHRRSAKISYLDGYMSEKIREGGLTLAQMREIIDEVSALRGYQDDDEVQLQLRKRMVEMLELAQIAPNDVVIKAKNLVAPKVLDIQLDVTEEDADDDMEEMDLRHNDRLAENDDAMNVDDPDHEDGPNEDEDEDNEERGLNLPVNSITVHKKLQCNGVGLAQYWVEATAGQVTRPAFGNLPVRPSFPIFHEFENGGTQFRDLVATEYEAEGKLDEMLTQWQSLKLQRCLGTMQGNHIRLMWTTLNSILQKASQLRRAEGLRTISLLYDEEIRPMLRKETLEVEESTNLINSLVRYAWEFNTHFPDRRPRTYTRLLVHSVPIQIDSGTDLVTGEEDWVESVIPRIKHGHSSSGGGNVTREHMEEKERQFMSKQLHVSDVTLSDDELDEQMVLQHQGSYYENAGGL